MQCRQCGAKNQPGATQCAICGALLNAQDHAGQGGARPPQQDRYIPGGGASANSAPPAPAQGQSSPSAPHRPRGSLGRRLAQQPAPSSADEDYAPPPRRARDDNYPPRRARDENYPQRGASRSRSDGRGRERDYDDEDADMDDGGRYDSAGRGGGRGHDVRPDWDEDRGRGSSARRSRDRDRGGPPLPPLGDESEEMIARRQPSRSGPRRRGPEPNLPEWSDEYPNPMDDSRMQQGMGAPRGRGGRHDADPRRYDSPTGYTDEERAARFAESAGDGYSEEYEARPRYLEERRGPTAGPRGASRSAPGGRLRDDERGDYDNYDAGGYGRPGSRSGPGGREMGGYDPRYPDVPSYEDIARGYPPQARGGQMGHGQQGGFGESSEWQPGGGFAGQAAGAQGPYGRASVGSRTTDKPRKSMLPMAFSLFVIVVVVVGLVAVVGPEFAPKLGKYLPFLAGGAQATPPPTFATYTPGPTPTLAPNTKLFSNKEAGFAIGYPSAWATSTASGANDDISYQFVAPGSSRIALVERAPAFDSASNDQLVQAEVTSAQGQGITMTEITSAATTEGVGGEVWIRREFQATKNGVKLHIAVLACHHLGKGFVIALISSDAGFAADDTATYEPMLRSFRFL